MKDFRYIPIRRRRPDAIDARDLPDAQVRIVREFVEFLQPSPRAAPGMRARAAGV